MQLRVEDIAFPVDVHRLELVVVVVRVGECAAGSLEIVVIHNLAG